MKASQVTRRQNVELVARARPSFRDVAYENCFEAPLAVMLLRAKGVRKHQTGGELAQELEQRQVGARR